MQQKEKEEEAIQQQYAKQCATNARKLQELADKRNEYPVSSTLIFKYVVTHFNSTFADR